MRKKILAVATALAVVVTATACSGGSGDREKLEMWFWGAPPTHRQALEENLVKKFNESQEEYELVVTFNERVDSNIQTALSANEGPDIVYGSGPAFVAPFARNGNLENLDSYAEKYGWKDRILAPIYEAGTVDGSLYALANSVNTIGVFYNKDVLDELGVPIPTNLAEFETALAAADAAGLYPSVTGNKGWQPVNENYSSLFFTAVAGPTAMYDVLTGARSWTEDPYVQAVEMSAEWFQNGYLGGGEYLNLNFTESMQLLSDGKSPFFIGPTLAFQFATDFFNEENGNVDDLGFVPFPTVGEGLDSPLYTLGTTASFSINANSKHKDAAAQVIDMMMTQEFMQNMTASWPGYWGTPLAGVSLDTQALEGLSKTYGVAINDALKGFEAGRFGYFSGTFYPPQTQQKLVDIDTVWLQQTEVGPFLQQVDETFKAELEAGAVPPIPKP